GSVYRRGPCFSDDSLSLNCQAGGSLAGKDSTEASSTRSNSWAGTAADSEGCCSAPVLNNFAGELIANSSYKRFTTLVAMAQEKQPADT
ncbi:MAG: hypothetical protein WA744_05315, partial [Candidatus Acidiferrales bacterium]